jgi:hypothetical protein
MKKVADEQEAMAEAGSAIAEELPSTELPPKEEAKWPQPPNPVCEVDPSTVQTVLLNAARVTGSFIAQLASARSRMLIAKVGLKKIEASLFDKYTRKVNIKYSAKEIEEYLFWTDVPWVTQMKELERLKAVVEYCENSIKASKDVGYNMRAYIEHLRWLEGEGRGKMR